MYQRKMSEWPDDGGNGSKNKYSEVVETKCHDGSNIYLCG